MSRPVTVVVAAVALVIAGVLAVVGLSQASVHYSLPSVSGVTRHSALFIPGFVATVVAGLVAAVIAVWVVLAAAGRSATWMLVAVAGMLLLDVAVIVVVSGLDRPSF